jgi:hypothetical protein
MTTHAVYAVFIVAGVVFIGAVINVIANLMMSAV